MSHLSLPICHLQVLRPELQVWERAAPEPRSCGCPGAFPAATANIFGNMGMLGSWQMLNESTDPMP